MGAPHLSFEGDARDLYSWSWLVRCASNLVRSRARREERRAGHQADYPTAGNSPTRLL